MKLATEVIEQAVPQMLLALVGWLCGRATRAVRGRLGRPTAVETPPGDNPAPAPTPCLDNASAR